MVSTTSAAGRAMAQVVSVFAELERALVTERTRAALAAKRAAGAKLGRPVALPDAVIARIFGERAQGRSLGDVDPDAGTVHVCRQVVEVDRRQWETVAKAASVRTVHLAEPGLHVLADHLAGRGPALPTARVFTRPDGSDLRHGHVERVWQAARARLGLPHVSAISAGMRRLTSGLCTEVGPPGLCTEAGPPGQLATRVKSMGLTGCE